MVKWRAVDGKLLLDPGKKGVYSSYAPSLGADGGEQVVDQRLRQQPVGGATRRKPADKRLPPCVLPVLPVSQAMAYL